jgi:hypothetical protein
MLKVLWKVVKDSTDININKTSNPKLLCTNKKIMLYGIGNSGLTKPGTTMWWG